MDKDIKPYADWAEQVGCAVTICDADCRILFMNEHSRQTFARHGDIIGHDLMQYHPAHAQAKIREMLSTGSTNAYTIEKKMQTFHKNQVKICLFIIAVQNYLRT